MIKVLAVGIGGFLGSISRYMLATWIHKIWEHPYPYGTFTVNILGCLLIGFLAGLSQTREIFHPQVRLLVFVGFLGAFTTFSAFGHETFALFTDGRVRAAVANIVLSIAIGLISVWLGYTTANLAA